MDALGITVAKMDEISESNGIVFRPVGKEDFAEWDRLWSLYLRFYETELPDTMHTLTFERYTTRCDMKAFFAVEKESGRIVGLANTIFQISGWLERAQLYLQDLFVDPSARKQGIGKAFLLHIKANAYAAGVQKIHWLTKETNYKARTVYDQVTGGKNGFIQYRYR